jgi:4-oxalocrotonate tautomerase
VRATLHMPPATTDGDSSVTLMHVKVHRSLFSSDEKAAIIDRLTEAMVEIEGEALRSTIWVTIEEVDPGHWGMGGRPLTASDVRDLATRGRDEG